MRARFNTFAAALAACLSVSSGGALAADRFLRYDVQTGVFCYEPSLPAGAAGGPAPCLPAPDRAFVSGDVIHLRILNPRMVSTYEIKTATKTIQMTGMQFRPSASNPIAAPEAEEAAEPSKAVANSIRAFSLTNEAGEAIEKPDVATVAARLATPAGIQEVRLEVRRARESAVKLNRQLDQDASSVEADLRVLMGSPAATCAAATAGDTLMRFAKLLECSQAQVNLIAAATPRPPRPTFSDLSMAITDLIGRGNLLAAKVSQSTAANAVAVLRTSTSTAEDSVADSRIMFARVLAAIQVAGLRETIPDADRELQVAEYRAKLKTLLPGSTDDELKALAEKYRSQLDKRNEVFRAAVDQETKELLGQVSRLRPQTDDSRALRTQVEQFATAARERAASWTQLQLMAEQMAARARAVFSGADQATALEHVRRIGTAISEQATTGAAAGSDLATLRREVESADAALGALNLSTHHDRARAALDAVAAGARARNAEMDSLLVSVDNLFLSEHEGPIERVIDQWMQNTDVQVTVTEKVNYTPFHRVAGVKAEENKEGNGSTTPAVQPSGLSSNFVLERSTRFQVHQVVRWKVIAGFVASSLRTREWDLRNREVKDANGKPVLDKDGNPTTENIMVRKQDDRPQLHYLLGAAIYLKSRDLFPGALRMADRFTPALLVGLALNDPKQYFFGPTFEPVTGLDLYVGYHLGREKLPIIGLHENSVVPSTYTSAPTRDALRGGVFFGIGFDLNVFRSVFGKPTNLTNLP